MSAAALVPSAVASPANAAANSNDELVRTWYQDFLGRSHDNALADGGRYGWVDLLDRGASREWVLGGLLRSYEYSNREVSSYYQEYLLRAPDAAAGYWIDQTANHGMAWEWVAQNILASREYINLWDYSAGAGYIRSLYVDILGRSASAGEVGYWQARYRAVGPLGVVREIWYTDEGVLKRLDDNYWDLLRRGADYGGAGYWAPYERESDITVQVRLASTPEYAGGWWTA